MLDGSKVPGRFVIDVGSSGALTIAKPFTVLLDCGRKNQIVERHAASDDPFEVDMTGLSMVPNGRRADGGDEALGMGFRDF